jgi:dolichyl-phosphate-mannose-protein mannosyltransferase
MAEMVRPGPLSRVTGTQRVAAPRRLRVDAYIVAALALAAAATRFIGLGHPATLVYDEKFTVDSARLYLQHLPDRETHPPLAAELIAICIRAFGDRAVSWRLAGASLGSALVCVTYLLGHRMFKSRVAAALAALFVLCDGQFLVDSRLAHWEIFYLTFAACAYLTLFRFAQSRDPFARRRTLVWMGIALGLCLASKLGIPLVTFALVMGAVAFVMVRAVAAADPRPRVWSFAAIRPLAGAFALVGGLAALVYILLFLPTYYFGWWHGVSDQISYFRETLRGQIHVPATHSYSSPWWSWPLLLRPLLYWNEENLLILPGAKVASILGIDNPVICWALLVSIPLAAGRAITRRDLAQGFAVLGYAVYLLMWIPVSRYKFLYYYMPALYLGFLSLAGTLGECWDGEAGSWEHAALLIALTPSMMVGLGIGPGLAVAAATAASYVLLLRSRSQYGGRFVCAAYAGATAIAFFYFLPIWTGTPITAAQLHARLWLKGSGLANWR